MCNINLHWENEVNLIKLHITLIVRILLATNFSVKDDGRPKVLIFKLDIFYVLPLF